jgi:putative ABC transport system permease protein
MQIAPMIRALGHRKTGVVLIALQIAISVAILANSLSIVQQRQRLMARPSGMDEANIFSFVNQFAGSTEDLSARIQADLARLRAMPGVVDASAVQSFPLRGFGASTAVTLRPEDKDSTFNAAEYALPSDGVRAWGLRLIAGRNFRSGEIRDFRFGIDNIDPPVAIITKALADRLFPHGNALGQNVYLGSAAPVRIVGIVERAQTPWAAQSATSGPFGAEESLLVPLQRVSSTLNYVVRTEPGKAAALLGPAQQQLFSLSRARIISSAQTFAETRAAQYRSGRALGLVLAVVCVLLLAVTALGIVALTTYWVTQRRRQIGMRRAVGARRVDILQYFHLENLLVAGVGVSLGIILGLAGNAWLATELEITRMSPGYIGTAAVVLLLLSQVAVLWPALRAAGVSPAAAIRGQ